MPSPTSDQRADHARDLIKHDLRPGDRGFSAPTNDVPDRLNAPVTTAMDIVVLVKAIPNYTDCAKLIDQYAGVVASCARAEEAEIALARLRSKDAEVVS